MFFIALRLPLPHHHYRYRYRTITLPVVVTAAIASHRYRSTVLQGNFETALKIAQAATERFPQDKSLLQTMGTVSSEKLCIQIKHTMAARHITPPPTPMAILSFTRGVLLP